MLELGNEHTVIISCAVCISLFCLLEFVTRQLIHFMKDIITEMKYDPFLTLKSETTRPRLIDRFSDTNGSTTTEQPSYISTTKRYNTVCYYISI